MVVAILLVLAFCLVLWALWLMRDGTTRRVRDRVREIGGAGPTAAVATMRGPSIRISEAGEGGRVARFFRYRPELPTRLPVVVVAALGGAVGLFAYWRVSGWFGMPVGMVGGAIAGVLGTRTLFNWQAQAYLRPLFEQLPDSLGFVVRSVKAGLPVAEALRGLAREMPEPTRSEFGRVVGEISIGRPVEIALWRLYKRTGLTEYAFFAVTLGLQAQTGGSLAETLENLADIVRKRVAMRSRARALAAEGRMSAAILVAMPFVAGLGLMLLSPGYMDVFFQSSGGQQLLITGGTLLALGLLTIRWLIQRATTD
ncbi:type II secretion system F family protein [Sabulicella glaciei]|uniref:Type II secretion system F family protein n=1 Tax=Sabulicella glaciei TaxID=2984948 RepID=A0ABT3NQ92_9PROT|nr:type II secretion system F family protein [Roseococcus sp. MDT2-1-1]MCW8084326.1 type II secretion system F family protein [Roseococcus sp. MDT2-1-1]